MSGRSKRRHGDSPVVDVADVFADDALIDALVDDRAVAAQTPRSGAHRGGGAHRAGGVDPLIELFDTWRDEISATPFPPAPAIRHASHAVAAGRHQRPRAARPTLFIAVAICALLIGSAAVGSRTARPGDTLWPLATVLWSDRLDSIHSLDEVKLALVEVQHALDAGRPDDARAALMRATVQLGHVDDLDMPASMPATLQKLWVDVVPEAQRRQPPTSASVAAAAADQSSAAHPSPGTLAGTPLASTPLLGTILEALIASAQPSVTADSSTSAAAGSSEPVAGIGSPPIIDPSTSAAATAPPADPSTDVTTAPTTDAPTDPSTDPAVPVTPTPPPASTQPPAETSPVVPVEPTPTPTPTDTQTAIENSPPAPPPPSTEPGTETTTATATTGVTSTDTSTPAVAEPDPVGDPGAASPASGTP